jgi:hypothetical protein
VAVARVETGPPRNECLRCSWPREPEMVVCCKPLRLALILWIRVPGLDLRESGGSVAGRRAVLKVYLYV